MTERLKPPGRIHTPAAEKEPLLHVYMKIGLGNGGVGEPVRIGLTPDGTVDLSSVPADLCKQWESRGIPSSLGDGTRIMPSEGSVFLSTLLVSQATYGPWFTREK